MKQLETLIPDIYNTLKSKEFTGDLNAIADQAGKEVAEAIVDAFTPYVPKKNLRMSGIGRCERAQWYGVKGYEAEEIDDEVLAWIGSEKADSLDDQSADDGDGEIPDWILDGVVDSEDSDGGSAGDDFPAAAQHLRHRPRSLLKSHSPVRWQWRLHRPKDHVPYLSKALQVSCAPENLH